MFAGSPSRELKPNFCRWNQGPTFHEVDGSELRKKIGVGRVDIFPIDLAFGQVVAYLIKVYLRRQIDCEQAFVRAFVGASHRHEVLQVRCCLVTLVREQDPNGSVAAPIF